MALRVRLRENEGFFRSGHIDSVFSSPLVVRCYVAKTFETPYGVKPVFDPRANGQVEMRELTAAMKAMTSIAKKMKKMENELGHVSDRDMPEFARRMLVASGIRTVLYEQKFNHGAKDGNGWDLKAGIFGLPSVHPRDGKDFLAVMHRLTDDTLPPAARQDRRVKHPPDRNPTVGKMNTSNKAHMRER